MEKPARRELVFHNPDDIVVDAENLRALGYTTAGNWNLAQIAGHLAAWIRFATDGYPRVGCFMGQIMWLTRVTVGRRMLRSIIRTNKMAGGLPTVAKTIPATVAEEAGAVTDLKEAIARFQQHQKEYHASPIFGRWTREECLKLNLVHAAHHLSFLIPKATQGD